MERAKDERKMGESANIKRKVEIEPCDQEVITRHQTGESANKKSQPHSQ